LKGLTLEGEENEEVCPWWVRRLRGSFGAGEEIVGSLAKWGYWYLGCRIYPNFPNKVRAPQNLSFKMNFFVKFFGMGNHLTFRWTEKTITWWRGCRRAWTVSRSEIVTLVLNMVDGRDLFLLSHPRFFGRGNHLGPWLTVTGTDRPKLQFHSMKLSLASYSPSIMFLIFISICGSWKWSQIISHTKKSCSWHQQ